MAKSGNNMAQSNKRIAPINTLASVLIILALFHFALCEYQPSVNFLVSTSVVDVSVPPSDVEISGHPIYFAAGTTTGDINLYDKEGLYQFINVQAAPIKKISWLNKYSIFVVTSTTAALFDLSIWEKTSIF